MEKYIVLVRHGQTDFNLQSRVQGSKIDSDINDTGRYQSEAFYSKYHDFGFESILVSQLKRTYQTIEPFVERLKLPFEVRSELNEISWGQHEGEKSSPERRKVYNAVIKDWNNGVYGSKIPGGQSAFDMRVQQEPVIDYIENHPSNKILICSHGRAMRSLICLMLGLPLTRMDDFSHDNTSAYHFTFSNGLFHLIKKNDLSHLHGESKTLS